MLDVRLAHDPQRFVLQVRELRNHQRLRITQPHQKSGVMEVRLCPSGYGGQPSLYTRWLA